MTSTNYNYAAGQERYLAVPISELGAAKTYTTKRSEWRSMAKSHNYKLIS